MPEATQNYSVQRRWHEPFHFVLAPIQLFHFSSAAYRLYQVPNFMHVETLLLSLGLLIMQVMTRLKALKAQDRIIQLEEQLRYEKVLSATLLDKASALPEGMIIALRAAPDEELPELIQQALDGKFSKPKEIKQAIKNWRTEHQRA